MGTKKKVPKNLENYRKHFRKFFVFYFARAVECKDCFRIPEMPLCYILIRIPGSMTPHGQNHLCARGHENFRNKKTYYFLKNCSRKKNRKKTYRVNFRKNQKQNRICFEMFVTSAEAFRKTFRSFSKKSKCFSKFSLIR